MSKRKVPECTVCHKIKSTECSHVDCPNRKPITARLGNAVTGYLSVGRVDPVESGGSFRAFPTKRNES